MSLGRRLAMLLLAACTVLVAGGERTEAADLPRCGIVNSAGVAFGSYDPRSPAPADSAGVIAYQCTGVMAGALVTIQLNRGHAGTFQPRTMTGPSSDFEYNLFLDAARTAIWGDGSNGTSQYSGRAQDGRTVTVTIFGRIPPRQRVRPGIYEDMIVATMLY